MLQRADGERVLTDIRHVAQLLHAEAGASRLGPSTLAAWLRARIREAREEVANEERSRRLETDAEAVQVLTVHRSKGLEFPIVYYPDLWVSRSRSDKILVYHDAVTGRRAIDVGGEGHADYPGHERLAATEQRGEDLRLAYVALTRARHQAVIWWATSWDSRESSLGRLLVGRGAAGEVAIRLDDAPHEDEIVDQLTRLSNAVPGRISVERVATRAPVRWQAPSAPASRLTVRPFARHLDWAWRRNSYSGITAIVHERPAVSEREDAGPTDEDLPFLPNPADGRSTDAVEAELRAVASQFGEVPGGTRTGTFIHAVLESVDFAAVDLDAELARAVTRHAARRQPGLGDERAVVAAQRSVIETPLGPSVGDLRLRDVGPRDRLNELAFELPLVGGDTPKARLKVADIARLLRAHLPATDLLAGYPDRLFDPDLSDELRGFLTGSLDLVIRAAAGRFVVVDYKSNWLGVEGETLSAWHYRPTALAAAMEAAHYPLQAVLYLVALHRYLRWRLPGYDPVRHVGGALYLFVRGMTGPTVPRVDGQPCGVFAWQPPVSLVGALSDLLDNGTPS
jgi:exodeoxyribonuclease V beta subunit